MASPIFDSINVALSRRIGDAVSSASDDGDILTASERDGYVNKALQKLFTEIIKNDSNVIAGIAPGLLRMTSVITLDGSGKYSFTSPNLDFYRLFGGINEVSSVDYYIRIFPASFLNIMKANVSSHYVSSPTNMAMIQFGEDVYYFPEDSTSQAQIQYIAKPVNQGTGLPFTNNDTYDIQFGYEWVEEITNLAEQIYRKEAQELV